METITEILSNIEKEHIQKECVNIINQLIIEDRTIADEIKSMTEIIGNMFFSELQKTKTITINNGNAEYKNGEFVYEMLGIRLNIKWKYYNMLSEDIALNIKSYANIDISKKILNICTVCYNGHFNKNDFYERLQHELHHLFERLRRGKPYRNIDKYNISVHKLTDAITNYEGIVANIMYISNSFEQSAFGNGAYQYLMQSKDYLNNFDNAIQNTQLFQWLVTLKEDILFIKKVDGNHPLMKAALKPYNISYNRLLKITAHTIHNLIKLIGRIKSKAIDDYKLKFETYTPQKPLSLDELKIRMSEIININKKYFN
jgi:hypothetical protein